MARWKLTEKAYLKLEEETRWEYIEVERVTGRPKRTQFVVPRYLDPMDPSDWTDVRAPKEDGDVILSDGHNANPKDLIYKGEPTPGMFPIDDEARAISAKYDWKPTSGVDEFSQRDSFTNQMLTGLLENLSSAKENAVLAQSASTQGFSEVLSAITKMMEQNQQILTKLVERQAPRRL